MKSRGHGPARIPRPIHSLFGRPSFWILAFIFLALITYSSIKLFEPQRGTIFPAPELSTDNAESICGNGLIESGEDCQTCFIDSPCVSNEVCSSGVCLQKKFNILILTIPAILLAILAIGLLGYQVLEFRGSRNEGEMHRIAGLIDYISKSIRAGQRETEIKINVIRAGWDKGDAARALTEAKKSLSER